MDWRIFISTFGIVFLAELGDKTQLTAMCYSATSKSTWTVFFGASVALVCSTLIAVLVGSWLNKQTYVSMNTIKLTAGILFLVLGSLVIREALKSETPEKKVAAQSLSGSWLVKSALHVAAQFESSTEQMYLDALEKMTDPGARDLLQKLAMEERAHQERWMALGESYAEEAVGSTEQSTITVPTPLPLAPAVRQVFVNLIQHEQSMVAFYQELARVSHLPALKQVFAEIAKEEQTHVTRLNDYLLTTT